MIDENECERLVIKYLIDKKRKAGKLKPAQQRHNIKQAQIWKTKVPRKNRD